MTIIYQNNFESSTGLQLFGDAKLQSGTLELTGSEPDKIGSAFSTLTIGIDQFTVSFDFKTGGGSGGADGLTFAMVQTPGVGGGGSDLGFSGLQGFAVEFDTYGDLSQDHIAIIQDNTSNHLKTSVTPELEDNQWRHVVINFEDGRMSVNMGGIDYINDYAMPVSSLANYYFGFTGATGWFYNYHTIDNFSISSKNISPTGTVTLTGNPSQGETLTASNNLADADGLGTITYQWLQDNYVIAGATGSTYTLTASDVGKTISVQASYTDGAGNSESVTSAATSAVAERQTAGVTITPLQTPSITSEGNYLVTGQLGAQAKFNVALTSQPTANVQITFASNNPAEGKPVNSVLIFTPENWNIAQILTIQGQDDLLNDGDVDYVISGTVSSSDIDYIRGIVVANQSLKNSDDSADAPKILSGDANGIPTRDRLQGGNGNDRLYGLLDIDELKGGLGNDRLYGWYDDDFLYGENGNDELYGEQDNDVLYGNDGNDTLDGGIGADTMSGGNGADVYYVDNADDVINDLGTDKVVDTVIVPVSISYALGASIESATLIGADNSRLTGNLLANLLTGNSGNNVLYGAAGNDTLNGGAGNDTLKGGTGIDTANYASVKTAVNANLTTGKATGDGIDVLSTIENILGGAGNDTLMGNSAINNLSGGAGNDKIIGGAGKDTLIGSAGADIFFYNAASDSGIGTRDVIKDFSSA